MAASHATVSESGTTPLEFPKIRPGFGIAALLGAAIGMATLSVVNFATEYSSGFLAWVWGAGKVWVPDATAVGPYSGLETFMILGWIGSWAGLTVAFRNRTEMATRFWVYLALGITIFAVILLWPPLIDSVLGK